MSFTAFTEPHQYMAGYSAIPLRVNSPNVATSENFKYIINVVFSGVTVTGDTAVGFGTSTFTQLAFDQAHGYNNGQALFLDDTFEQLSGFFNIVSLPSVTSAIINLPFTTGLSGTAETFLFIPYELSTDLDGEAKLDLSNTLRDFVTQNLQDVNEAYPAPDTVFSYDIFAGEKSNFVFTFTDNVALTGQSGNIGFANSGLTQAFIDDTLPFKVGDQVIIDQDLAIWNYDDNVFARGSNISFTYTTNQHDFRTGQTVEVTGQITNASYNGPVTVQTVFDDFGLKINKPIVLPTPVEPGQMFGVPRPEYNGTFTIQDILFVAGTGVTIVVDNLVTDATQPLGGTVKLIDDQTSSKFKELVILNKNIFNAHVNRPDYGFNRQSFDPFIIKASRLFNENNTSTILSGTSILSAATKYRIERNTKSWLLHHIETVDWGSDVKFTWFDSGSTELGQSFLFNVSGNRRDYYFPVGIDQLTASANRVDISAALSSFTDSIDFYKVEGIETVVASAVTTNAIWFELNDDCSRFELFHLMWKDKFGSWLSYPFKYISEDKSEVERKDFYKTEGNFNTDNNTFGYNDFDRGQETFFVRIRDKHKLNTGWVEKFENELIEDLWSSSSVYMQLPDNRIFPVNIQNKEFQDKKIESDYLWNYTFDVVISFNENRF